MFNAKVFTDRRFFNTLAIGVIAFGVAACNDTGDEATAGNSMPQQSASDRPTQLGDCRDLIGRLSGLANTQITSSTEIAAGELSVGGEPIAAHCLVTGRMHERTSPVDNNTYAMFYTGFEVLPPFVAYSPVFLGQEVCDTYLEDYSRRLSEIDTTAPMKFHPLTDFGPDFKLKPDVTPASVGHKR